MQRERNVIGFFEPLESSFLIVGLVVVVVICFVIIHIACFCSPFHLPTFASVVYDYSLRMGTLALLLWIGTERQTDRWTNRQTDKEGRENKRQRQRQTDRQRKRQRPKMFDCVRGRSLQLHANVSFETFGCNTEPMRTRKSFNCIIALHVFTSIFYMIFSEYVKAKHC